MIGGERNAVPVFGSQSGELIGWTDPAILHAWPEVPPPAPEVDFAALREQYLALFPRNE